MLQFYAEKFYVRKFCLDSLISSYDGIFLLFQELYYQKYYFSIIQNLL